MSLKNTNEKYGTLSIAMHWLMLFLMIFVYACMELKGYFPKGSFIRSDLKNWHFASGLIILFLVFIRVGLRLTQVTPKITPPIPKYDAILANIGHILLYAFMIAMPIIGWLILSAEGESPFNLPAIASVNKKLAHNMEELHELIANLGYFLIGLHTLAALVHHYILKDNTLIRILPRKSE